MQSLLKTIFDKCFSSFITDLSVKFGEVFNGLKKDIELLKKDGNQVNKTIKELQEENTNIKSRIAKLEEAVTEYFSNINSMAAKQKEYYEQMLKDFEQVLKFTAGKLKGHQAITAFPIVNDFLCSYVLENHSESEKISLLEEKRNRCIEMTKSDQIDSYFKNHFRLENRIKCIVNRIDSFFAHHVDFQKQIIQ